MSQRGLVLRLQEPGFAAARDMRARSSLGVGLRGGHDAYDA